MALQKNDVCFSTRDFDAFLLYSNQDRDFAYKIVDRLEPTGLRLCLLDRDLIASLGCDELIEFIDNWCTKLIVILSPDFVNSPENMFLTSYFAAMDITRGQWKVTPVLYRESDVSQRLRQCALLDYQTADKRFWRRLMISLKSPNYSSGPNVWMSGRYQHCRNVVSAEVLERMAELPDVGTLLNEEEMGVFFDFFSKETDRTRNVVLQSGSVDDCGDGDQGKKRRRSRQKGIKDYFEKLVEKVIKTFRHRGV